MKDHDIVGLTNDTQTVSLIDGPMMPIYTPEQFDEVAQKLNDDMYFMTIRETQEVFWYDSKEGFYRPHGDKIIGEYCQLLIRKCNNKAVNEVVGTIRRLTGIDLAEIYESNFINTQNGILDPETFELQKHSPDFKTLSKLPFRVEYHSKPNPKLWNHILTIVDPYDIPLILELFWICISGHNPYKKCFVFKGITNTQKSTMADIIALIIGEDNVSRERTESFLGKYARFGSSQFIGKRMNIASEIGNLDGEGLEKLKSYVGAEKQNTERKNSNIRLVFDPTRFVFLFTTNQLNAIYSSINDASVITRFQFLIFRNQITDKADGTFLDYFFDSPEDRKGAISTLVKIIISYKKAQKENRAPKTEWSTITETKNILKENKPKEDQYFEDEGRLVKKTGARLSLEDIIRDFNKFTGEKYNAQQMGIILNKNGFETSRSEGIRYLKGITFRSAEDEKQARLK